MNKIILLLIFDIGEKYGSWVHFLSQTVGSKEGFLMDIYLPNYVVFGSISLKRNGIKFWIQFNNQIR